MTDWRVSKTMLLSSLAVLICLIGTKPSQGQDDTPDPTAITRQPFAALGALLSSAQANNASLATTQRSLKKDRAKIKKDRADLKTTQDQVDRLRSDIKAAKSKLSGASKKWLCNRYGTYHDDPKDCSAPGDGGVWVTRDADGRTSRWVPPTKADRDRITADETRLALLETRLARNKDQLSKDEQAYRSDNEKFAKGVEAQVKKVSYLSDPSQVLADLQKSYKDAAAKTGKVDPAVIQGIEKMVSLFGKKVDTGECVALVQAYDKSLGQTKNWKPDDSKKIVKGSDVVPLAPAATFVNGKYESNASGNHAVLVLANTPEGLLVFDQHSKKTASPHLIPYLGGRDTEANQAKIQKGLEMAKEKGLTASDGKAYWNAVYNYPGGYNPSNDASNYSYIKSKSSE